MTFDDHLMTSDDHLNEAIGFGRSGLSGLHMCDPFPPPPPEAPSLFGSCFFSKVKKRKKKQIAKGAALPPPPPFGSHTCVTHPARQTRATPRTDQSTCAPCCPRDHVRAPAPGPARLLAGGLPGRAPRPRPHAPARLAKPVRTCAQRNALLNVDVLVIARRHFCLVVGVAGTPLLA